MELTHAPAFYPGTCVSGMGDTEFVDFKRDLPPYPDGAHFYMGAQLVRDAARLIGFKSPEEVVGLVRENEALKEVAEERDQLRHELEALRRAVGYTLNKGAVIDQRSGKPTLRSVPGERKVHV